MARPLFSLLCGEQAVWPRKTKKMHVHCHTHGSIKIPKLLPLSSVSVASSVFFHFEVLPTISTMELAFNRSPSIHAMLIHTIAPAFYRLPSIHVMLIIMYHEAGIYRSWSVHAKLVCTIGTIFCHSPLIHM